MNVEIGSEAAQCAITRKGIHKWDFPFSVAAKYLVKAPVKFIFSRVFLTMFVLGGGLLRPHGGLEHPALHQRQHVRPQQQQARQEDTQAGRNRRYRNPQQPLPNSDHNTACIVSPTAATFIIGDHQSFYYR
jgi:hypothetical protein